MSDRAWNIVRNVEKDFGVEIDDYPLDILCFNEGCRWESCDCWDSLRAALEEIAAEKAQMRVNASLANEREFV